MNTIYIDLTNTSKHVEVEKLQMRKDNNGNDLNISKSPPERDCDSINFSQRNRKSINLSDDSAMYRSTKHIENKTNEVIASTPIMSWDKYRPRGAMNFSDLLEDKTIDARNMSPSVSTPNLAKNIPIDKNHGPAAASVRDPLKESTSNAQNMSVNMILDSSFVQAIRDRSKMVANIDRKQSSAENMTSANSSKPISNVSKNNFSQRISESIRSDEFVPFDEAQEKIDQDEKEWQNEFGALPAESDSVRSSEKSVGSYRLPQSKLVNLTEFSGYLADSNAEFSKMSLGNFFARRTEDIRTIIPNKSPSKIHKPVPLIASTNTSVSTGYESSIVSGKTSASTSFYTDDELKIKSLPKINNATYDKKPVNSERSSVLSVSNIANKLNDDAADSPATIVSQFTTAMRSKSMKSLNSVSQASSQASSTNSNNFMKKFTTIDQQKNPNEIPKDFATLRQELGMLAQMNSTAFDELPKGGRWRPNESAETESICESSLNITDFHTDFSSTGYGYDSSAPKNAHRDKKGAKKVKISPPTQAEDTRKTKGKRMRSPSSNPPDRIVDVHVPEISFQNLQISSPSKAQRTSDENRAPAKVDASHMPRQLMVDRSPIDGSKFSLPNYGLKARSISSSPTAVGIGRTNSQCSTNSEFYQNDGKFPLKSNRMAISWECVKLRKGISKSFFIKNTSMKRMTLNMEVTGPGFQIESSSQTSGPLILQGNECRTISVVFCPTVLGKAIGKVIFRPLKGWSEDTERHVYLFGYGGSTTLQLRGIERGPVGSAFLKMAETSTITSTSLKRWFSIYNKGPLPGMATITTKPKSNQYINDTHVIIEPNKCVIAPDSSVDVMVTYKLRRKDLEKLSQKSCEVLTVATLEVIIGADANRQRIVEILTNTENNIPAIYKSLNFLVDDFPNKHAENMSEYRESVDDVGDLFSCFKTTEVALTINRTTLDETRDTCNELSGIEDSVFFRTLIGSGSVDRAEAGGGHGNGNGTTLNRSHKLSVSPTRLFMDQLNNTSKTLTIKNEYNRTQTFQIESNFRHLISFSKSSGRISAGRELNVDVHLKTGVYVPNEVIITVYIESDCIEIPVTVKPTQINHINKF